MNYRERFCAACNDDQHNRCRDPECGCCGDYDEPERAEVRGYEERAAAPFGSLVGGDDPYALGREEDARLAQQFGAWPETPEASRR